MTAQPPQSSLQTTLPLAGEMPPENPSGEAPVKPSNKSPVSEAFRELTRVRGLLWPKEKQQSKPHICLKELRYLKPRVEACQHAGLTRAYYELQGYAHWEQRQYRQAAQAFEDIPDGYLAGLMHLASGNVTAALQQFTQSQQVADSPEARNSPWGQALLGLVSIQLNTLPSILQVRQHLEANIALLLEAGQTQMLNNLSNYTDLMGQINPEGYKLIGRGVFNGGGQPLAGQWLLLAQKHQPQDPEVYYHLGQWYAATQQYLQAKRALQQCLMMSPIYPPADALLASLPAT